MSIRTVADRIKEQNALLVEMSEDNQKNSESLQQSIGELNAVLSSIHKVLLDQEKEEETEKSREKLQDKDKEEERKSLFSGFLGQREGGKKESKGMLGMIGKIFTKALGFLVKSLPLIGLASLFFGDAVTGLLTAALGDYDQASILKNIIAGGLIGSIFGFRAALIGAIVGLIFSPEAREKLKEEFGKIVSIFETDGLLAALSALGPLASGLGMLALALAPFRTMKMAWSALKGTLNLIGGIFGLKGIGAPKLPDGGKTPTTMAKAGSKVGGLVKAGATGAIGLVSKLIPGSVKQGAAGVLAKSKGFAATSAAKSMSAIKSAPGKLLGLGKSAVGGMAGVAGPVIKSATGSVAKTVGKKAALGAAAKAIPGLGILAGIGFGLSSLKDGDPVAAGLHIASGIAGTIPGLGTAASLALTGAATAREMGQLGGSNSDVQVSINGKSESLNEATRERDELVAKTSSNVIMDNSTTNNVSGGGGGVSISSPITFFDNQDPYLNSGR